MTEYDDTLRPGPIRVPRRDAVETDPIIFDTRTQAWKIYHPDSPEALDKSRSYENWPRQKAASSCNLLELYDRIQVCFEYFQMEFRVIDNAPSVIEMPFQLIEPKSGWKLRNQTTGKEYLVKSTGRTNTRKGPIFNGTIYLDREGPSIGEELVWIDPDGTLDQQAKLIRIEPADSFGAVMQAQAGQGDMAGSKSKPFVPMVTYELVRHEPGSVGDHPFSPTKQTKPRLRESIPDPHDPREMVEINGWWMDSILEFKCVAMSADLSDRMTLWVRNFFQLYTSVLMLLGVKDALYWQTMPAKTDGRPTNNLYIRSLQYYFRLEEISIKRRTRLQYFNLVERLLGPGEEILASGETSELDLDRWASTHDPGTSGDYLYGNVSIGDD